MPGNKASDGPLPLHFEETHAWLPAINATYHLGIDGISAWLLALNAGVFLLGALAISRKSTDRLRFYCTLVLLTEAATTGVLLSIDLLLFYMFWEGMLVPLYVLLSNWGGDKRGPATIKFIVYTVAGSLLMLVAIIYLYVQSPSGSFDLENILAQPISSGSAFVIPIIHLTTFTPKELAFICFALAFAIKIPIVPLHTWLPDLYEACPPAVLVFFAGIVSKLGAYGFIRFALTLFPGEMEKYRFVLAGFAVLSIIYGALMALSERDLKRIVAYASISHLGFIALGIFSLTNNGINGAVIQMVNHGIIISALFLIVGFVEARTGTRDLRELSGLERRMPWLYFFFLVATLASLGMPGMNSFVGEFTIMLGAFQLNWVYAVLAGGGVILAAWYMLRLHQGLMHDPPKPRTEGVHDLHFGEGLLLVPLVALMIFIGLYPKPITDVTKGSVSTYREPDPARRVDPGHAVMLIAASPVPLSFPGGRDLVGILPELVLGGAFLLLMLLDLVVPASKRTWLAGFALLGIAATFGVTVWAWFDANPGRLVYSGSFAYDRFALFVDAILLVSAGLVVMISPNYLNRRGIHYGEYYALILAATIGMMLLAGATSLMVIFLAIELLSLALYVLSGFSRHEERSQEAALKYLLLGGFASGFLLFGMALIYGETGHTQLAQIAAAIQSQTTIAVDPLLLAGCPAAVHRLRVQGVAPRRSTRGRPTCTRARRRRSRPS